MTTLKATKRALISSVFALILCFAMLLGTTYAWFTDSVTSANNIIQSGSLKIDLIHNTAEGDVSIKDKPDHQIFKYEKWEPGYTQVETLTIVNKGTLALKYKLILDAAGAVNAKTGEKLSDVIDVYVCEGVGTADSAADLANEPWTKLGILTDVLDMDGVISGNLLPKGAEKNSEEDVVEQRPFTIALHMQESAGNVYQNLSLGKVSVKLLATQYTYEEDAFDETYDEDASLDIYPVNSFEELKMALANKVKNITLTADVQAPEALNADYAVTINGGGYTISRTDGYTGTVITADQDSSLTLENIVLDGSGATATGNLISAGNNAEIILNEGTVLQNNHGAHAVNLGTRIGATLTLNGAHIINNSSDSGAIWGGGHITINEGSKINDNSSTGAAGAIRMVGKCNLTMNGGEICNNVAATDGGAIWGYGVNGNSSVYDLKGGKISNNTAGGVGGAIYTGTYSTINLSGDFEICNNTAADSGALRLTNYTILNMTGGKISGNESTNNADYNGFYGWCPRLTITGGELADNIYLAGGHTPTVGGDGITGVVNFNIGTNHNTINLAANFGEIRFVAVEGDNFAAFNFKPAADYTYTEGDEAKLVCLNEGYETYWDAATGTFRLQENN